MKQSWEERIAAASLEKQTTEKTEHGFYIKSLLVDFFISERVIPSSRKNYRGGVVKSYNLKGLDEYDLIVNEVFLRNRHKFSSPLSEKSLDAVKHRMNGLWLILESQQPVSNKIAEGIFKNALLGALGSLFSVFSEDPEFCDILNLQYIKIFRKMVFHFKFIFNPCDIQTLKLLCSHFYEHCRGELNEVYRFKALSKAIQIADRQSRIFKHWIIQCLNTHSALYEYVDSVKKRLSEDKQQLEETLDFLKLNPCTLNVRGNSKEMQVAICGNALGLFVANLSANTMSLLNDRTYSEKMLSNEDKKSVSAQYGHLVPVGIGFRHNRILYLELPKIFDLEISPRVQPTVQTPLKSRKLEMNPQSYLWGVLNNGKVACSLNDTESLHLLSTEDDQTDQELMLNPQSFNYFSHACLTAPVILLTNNTLVIGAYQYIHLIDLHHDMPEPEKVIILKNEGVTSLLPLGQDQFAVGGGTGNVMIYDTHSPRPIQTLPGSGKLHSAVSAIAQLPNNRLAVGYNDCVICIWNLETATCEITLKDFFDMDAYIFDPSSSHHHPKISSVRVGGKPQGGIICLAVNSEGNLLAGYGDNGIYLWDIKQQQPIKSFIGHTGWPTCLKILPDNRLVSVGLDKAMKVWSEEACERSIALSHGGHSIEVVDDQLIIADRKAATLFSLSELNYDIRSVKK